MLLMNLEQRPIVFEDIGRQVLSTGERKRPQYFIQAIGNFCRLRKMNNTFVLITIIILLSV